MSIEFKNIKITIGFAAAVFFAFVFNSDHADGYVISCVSAASHEIIHLLFLFICGVRNISVDILPGGIRIKSGEAQQLNYKKTILCTLCAPVFNLITAGICYIVNRKINNELLTEVAVINLVLGAVNLLPLSFLDGGRAFRCVISEKRDEDATEIITKRAEIICLALTGLPVIYLCFSGDINIVLLVFYVYCIINCVSKK